jgi:hypothetical protein
MLFTVNSVFFSERMHFAEASAAEIKITRFEAGGLEIGIHHSKI